MYHFSSLNMRLEEMSVHEMKSCIIHHKPKLMVYVKRRGFADQLSNT